MLVLPLDWLTVEPLDYEFKYYKLMSSLQTFESLLDENKIGPIFEEIELHLQQMYTFKYNKSKIDSQLMTLKGINWDMMSLEYDLPTEKQEVRDAYQLCDESILLMEEMYKKIIKKWRKIELDFSISELSQNNEDKKMGSMLVYDNSKRVHHYLWAAPMDWSLNWRYFKLIYEWSKKEDPALNVEIEQLCHESRVFKCQTNKEYPHDECIVPITAYSLFNYLKKKV